ncbi:hypothetical protein GCM10012284_37420 [Mangrovihabitans endophyticus]|uniref:ABC-type branched-chain amino acid transport system, substrate-binding protein n=2 Tax=Mangrovihabitans endophyticus TaxID=1751298 RepID=A0A8J3C2C1_9ACTN|nr:hypothetical protein GCM10012284_37420 [Mangrovihabitans endophyticus]
MVQKHFPRRPIKVEPFWQKQSSRIVSGIAGIALFVTAIVVLGYSIRPLLQEDVCDGLPDGVTEADGEKVGYRLCGMPFWAGDDEKGIWENKIYEANRTVRKEDKRGFVTILVVTSLASPDGPESVVPETQGLSGVYAAQREINERGSGPKVRLAVVNTGRGGAKVKEALDEVQDLIDADKNDADKNRVIGAVTSINSTVLAKKELQRLDDVGIVQVSPTMTADGFGSKMHHFFQLVSPNKLQSDAVIHYVVTSANGKVGHLLQVSPGGPDDLYVTSLFDAVQGHLEELKSARIDFQRLAWSQGGNGDLSIACAKRGEYEAVFFGGRYIQFGEFAEDLRDACGRKMPKLIADDSTSRFLMDAKLTRGMRYGIEATIVSRGPLLTCAQLNTLTGKDPSWRRDFADALRDATGRCSDPQSRDDALAGGWTPNAYDAVELLHDPFTYAQVEDPDKMRSQLSVKLEETNGVERGTVSPIHFADRVSDRGVWLYHVPELRTMFAAGRSPAKDSATPVMCYGNSYAEETAPGRCVAPSASSSTRK